MKEGGQDRGRKLSKGVGSAGDQLPLGLRERPGHQVQSADRARGKKTGLCTRVSQTQAEGCPTPAPLVPWFGF